jgi:hypothetical protein
MKKEAVKKLACIGRISVTPRYEPRLGTAFLGEAQ